MIKPESSNVAYLTGLGISAEQMDDIKRAYPLPGDTLPITAARKYLASRSRRLLVEGDSDFMTDALTLKLVEVIRGRIFASAAGIKLDRFKYYAQLLPTLARIEIDEPGPH